MTSFEKTLYIQRLLYQLHVTRKQIARDNQTESLISMYEIESSKALDNSVESLQEALTVAGFFPAIKEI